MTTWDMQFRALPGIGLIESGTDLAAVITKAAEQDGLAFAEHDGIVLATIGRFDLFVGYNVCHEHLPCSFLVTIY